MGSDKLSFWARAGGAYAFSATFLCFGWVDLLFYTNHACLFFPRSVAAGGHCFVGELICICFRSLFAVFMG
jgi:hypothetical protein